MVEVVRLHDALSSVDKKWIASSRNDAVGYVERHHLRTLELVTSRKL